MLAGTSHKISARERDTAPRYYYKRTRTYTCCERIKNFFRAIFAFFFTQIGVSVVVALYMVLGAYMFSSLEAESQMECAVNASRQREQFAEDLWIITMDTNELFPQYWANQTEELLFAFQNATVENYKKGYTGNEVGVTIWTFPAALMFSLTVFTTIGYGTITPKTPLGKLTTIFYALAGIPLLFLYISTIGQIMGNCFRYTYSKLCRCKKPANAMPSKASLPSSLVEPTDATPHSLDVNSVGRQSSKLSSSRSTKPSSNSSKEDGTTGNGTTLTPTTSSTKPSFLRQPFKNFRKTRSTLIEKDPESNNLMPRRPSLVVTQSSEADLLETTTNSYNSNNNNALRLPDMSITPPITPNNTHSSFLQAPSFLKGSLTPMLTRKRQISGSFSKDIDNDNVTTPDSNTNPKVPTVEFKLVEDLRLVTVPVTSCLIVLFLYIAMGTVLFSHWESWSYLDGAYFCFISLMTIGFGDFVPGSMGVYQATEDIDKSMAEVKLVIAVIYILIGMAVLAMLFNLVQEQIVVQVRSALRRIRLLRGYEHGTEG